VADPKRPGCTVRRCDVAHLCMRGNLSDGCMRGRGMCGFVGAPTTGFNVTAWSPRHLGLLLRMHQMYGVDWSPPGFHSGYNEVIIASALSSSED